METTNPTHFQLYIQITHYADISRYCTGSHMSRSVIMLLYWKSPDQKCYCATSHMLPNTCNNSRKEIFSCFDNSKNCTNQLY